MLAVARRGYAKRVLEARDIRGSRLNGDWTGCRQSRRPLQAGLDSKASLLRPMGRLGRGQKTFLRLCNRRTLPSLCEEPKPVAPAQDRLCERHLGGRTYSERSTNLPRESAIYASQSLYFSVWQARLDSSQRPLPCQRATIRFSTCLQWVRELPNTRNYLLARQGKLTLGLRIGLEDSLSLHNCAILLPGSPAHRWRWTRNNPALRADYRDTGKTRTPGLGSWSYVRFNHLLE